MVCLVWTFSSILSETFQCFFSCSTLIHGVTKIQFENFKILISKTVTGLEKHCIQIQHQHILIVYEQTRLNKIDCT